LRIKKGHPRIDEIGPGIFIRLRQNTLRLAAGMNGKSNHGVVRKSEAGLAMP
jgi:hypothetical protein